MNSKMTELKSIKESSLEYIKFLTEQMRQEKNILKFLKDHEKLQNENQENLSKMSLNITTLEFKLNLAEDRVKSRDKLSFQIGVRIWLSDWFSAIC